MRKVIILVSVLAFALAGCKMHSGSSSDDGTGGDSGGGTTPAAQKPVQASIKNTKGLFLHGSGISTSRMPSRNGMSFDTVTASGASLGAVDASGVPIEVTWTDAEGAAVIATVSKAKQLTAEYVLLSYTSEAGSGTATLALSTGALAEVSVVPDNWDLIFARGASAWYVAGGAVYRMDLASGVAGKVSDGAPSYGSGGISYWDGGNVNLATNPKQSTFSSWDANTWIYVDISGNAYALDMTPSGFLLAMAFPSSQNPIDFGMWTFSYSFGLAIPLGYSGSAQNYMTSDSTTGDLFIFHTTTQYSGGTSIGTCVQLLPVTLDPASASVLSIGLPAVQSTITAAVVGVSNIAGQIDMTRTLFSNGPQTWTVASGGILTSWDTSAVPVVNNGIIGLVLNWQYSGGSTYAGPALSGATPAVTGIHLADFSTSSVSSTELVADPGIVSWTVVGGVLFYTTAAGTYEAAVDTGAHALGAVKAYSGGQVQAVTQ